MIDDKQRYEDFIDNELIEFMSRITVDQIEEAFVSTIPRSFMYESIAKNMRTHSVSGMAIIGANLEMICRMYWRTVIEHNHNFHDTIAMLKEDAQAEKDEDRSDAYEQRYS